MQLCFWLVLSVLSWERGLSVASLLHGQAVFAKSVSGQGFPPFWVVHGSQVLCHGVVSVEGLKASKFTLVFSGIFPMYQILFLLFSYNLVLPDVLVVTCWTDSQDKSAKGTLFWV